MSQKNQSPLPLGKARVREATEEVPKMWWWGGYHWWWPGPVLMCVGMLVCMAVMALMMGHGRMPAGMFRFWARNRPGPQQADTSGQILDERLARGEIDIDEYRRIQQTLTGVNSPAGSEEQAGSQR